MNHADYFDGLTETKLRGAGSRKWTTYPDAIGAFIAEMDFGTAPEVQAALQEPVGSAALGYAPVTAVDDMTRACSAWLESVYGWTVPATDIRPIPDVLAGIVLAITHYSAPGSAIVLPTPAHMPFLKIPASLNRRIIQVPMTFGADEWKLDLEGIDAAFAAGGGLLIFCNPHNPIGKVYSRAEMLELSEIVEKHGARVCSDEIHAPLVFSSSRHVPYASVSPAAAKHTVTVASATKAWNMSGLKCAQIIFSNSTDQHTWSSASFMAEHGVGYLGVLATTAAYSEGKPWLDEVITYLDHNRQQLAVLLAEHLPEVRYHAPEGTYLAWLDCRSLDLGNHPAEFFLENAEVACSDGAGFGDNGAGYLRFNLAMPTPILKRAVRQMGEAFRKNTAAK
ncbi:MAG: MalY/PatB family protein [Arthrobacter sp.]|uniref:MalY/PatB family protein n=1 Tax=unclassified Arthrobacter TaxID=235627 RepID=UPI0026519D46|nr:aminotransferase class I/II-fold pyridoxal phosphate-dependent enzyme [Micrococcaceae bacterium]MDN5812915.1 aminotransferase class I/II-fold pyridoxal phosphate-dependent enzyme [Micrococcaceae bacterium]MDN5824426.1 aminotransferase class I/II-fold pyridoxal phosphate-dependent enzyme [Micrococcaceae bacterium]MDN5880084.1 aminotransferase class I/II-fold pyridoxal phosphate-dependent enzyme [Micrococcaceae bacterium]MDN5886757.1 aminotransferase class I/II-fold pyridoxal phosphate-depende